MVYHKAASRGFADHGWLKSHHTFSFANYYDPERINFGALRVLNDDFVEAGMGFGTHPHSNMEIISIPLEGDLEHKDSMGNTTIIRNGDIQVMSAGRGITHSEYNKNEDIPVKFLQIWVIPNQKNVTPRYDQISLNPDDRRDRLQQILSPNKADQGVWIHQDAWFHMGTFSKGHQETYTLKREGNGIYVFLISGSLTIGETILSKRDGLGIMGAINIKMAAGDKDTEVLVLEVPMTL